MRGFLLWLLRVAEEDLADEEHHSGKWGWSYKPSEWSHHDRKVTRLRRRVDRRRGWLGREPLYNEDPE
jgi:hypothetical protein